MTPYELCPTLPDTYQTQKHVHPLNCCTPQFHLTQGTADHIEHDSTHYVPLVQQLLPHCRWQNTSAECSLLC